MVANWTTLSEFEDLDWHVIPPCEIYERLSTSPQQGLSNDQVARKLKEYGPNTPSTPPSRWFRKALGYLFGGFGPILFVASILVFVAWKPLGEPNPAIANLALGIVLAIVFFAQALFAFAQGAYFLSIRTQPPLLTWKQIGLALVLWLRSPPCYQTNALFSETEHPKTLLEVRLFLEMFSS
jgi:magnesium-transporting ATPase (P-type)